MRSDLEPEISDVWETDDLEDGDWATLEWGDCLAYDEDRCYNEDLFEYDYVERSYGTCSVSEYDFDWSRGLASPE